METTDIVIVGAGAAGLAAARELAAMGVGHLVVEAKPAIGGRAFCDETSFGFPYDLGAFWLSDDGDNRFIEIAAALGFDISDPAFPWSDMPMILGDAWETQAQNAERLAYNEGAFAAIGAFEAGARDRAIADLAGTESPWFAVLNSWMGMLHNRRMDLVSALDQTRLLHGTYHQVREGMGNLVRAWGDDPAIRVGTPVTAIDWSASGLELVTAHGPIAARAAIVTASTGVLSSGVIRLARSLPDGHRAALDLLPMGNVNRIAVQFDGDVFGETCPPCFGRYVSPHDYIYVMTRLVGQNVALGYVGNDLADALEDQPDSVAVDLLCDALGLAIGADVRSRIVAVVCTRWRADPWTLGAYAMAAPGGGDARRMLQQPVGERLFLAGEATSLTQFAHVHGAANEGTRAARAAAAVL